MYTIAVGDAGNTYNVWFNMILTVCTLSHLIVDGPNGNVDSLVNVKVILQKQLGID